MLRQIEQRWRWKRLSVDLIFVLLVTLMGLSGCAPKVEVQGVSPEVDISKLGLSNISVNTATVDVTVTVKNPNSIGATLDRIAYDIYFQKDRQWPHLGKADREEDVSIRANGLTTFDISNEIELAQAVLALYQFLSKQGSVNLKVSGSAWLKVGPASFEVPFEQVKMVTYSLPSAAPTPTPEETPTPLPEEKPTPEPAPAPAPYTETKFSLTPGEVYRVSIFAEDNDAIEGSWKAEDDHIYVWYTTPSGIPMLPGVVRGGLLIGGGQITPPHYTSSGLIQHEPYHGFPTFPAVWGYTFEIRIEGKYHGTGYYTFCFMPGRSATKPVPVVFRYRVNETPSTLPRYPAPEPATPTTTPEPATISSAYITSSDITSEPSAYDGKEVELSGQAYLAGSPPRLLVDGKSGVNIAGNTAALQKGFYRLTGVYDADTNTLDVTESSKEEVEYLAIEAGKELGIDLIPVSVEGLVATVPKDIADSLTAYISVPYFPEDVPIYPYVVYAKDGFYLVLSDTLAHLPAEFTCLYQGRDYSFTFSAGEVKGTLVKTPAEEIDFGPKWQPDEFGGVVIANSINPLDPIEATVGEINASPDNFVFKRVSISGSYIVTTARVDYSEIEAPMGQGILADKFSDFFEKDAKKRLETIDPERKVWQLRRGEVIGTILYPTEEILKYLDYSRPLSKSEVKERLKPALIVDSLVDEVERVANISELNPLTGEPSRYWGKVVEFAGYALGMNIPIVKYAEEALKAVYGEEVDIPVEFNLLAVGIADKPTIGSQLAIIGLNNELIDEKGETIQGRYRFRVAITEMPEELVSGVPYADTAFFLLSKEELPIEISILPLEITSVTSPVQQGQEVTLTAQTSPEAICTISILGQSPKTADADGIVSWTWEVSSLIPPGILHIVVTATKDTQAGSAEAEIVIEAPVSYTLSVSVDPSGVGSVIPPGGVFTSGTDVILTAVPAPRYLFDHWSGDASGTDNPTTVTMDSDKSITAHFKEKEVATYSLNVSIDPSGTGSVTLLPPGGSYPAGTVVTLTAIPVPGYVFDHWSGDASGTSAVITVTMDSDKSVTVCFKRIL